MRETGAVSFVFQRHYAYCVLQYNSRTKVSIGCITKTLGWWLSNYRRIGKKEGYSSKEIAAYGAWLRMLKKLNNKKKG
jgi:hypothetical protein